MKKIRATNARMTTAHWEAVFIVLSRGIDEIESDAEYSDIEEEHLQQAELAREAYLILWHRHKKKNEIWTSN